MTTAAPPGTRQLVTGGDPDAQFPVPGDEQFGICDFMDSEDLRDVGEALVGMKLAHLKGEVTIRYLWKKTGGASSGNVTFGKCVKNSGLAKFYANERDYTIWLAADHVRTYDFNRYQLEALMYHELLHIDYEPETEDTPARMAMKGHDVEVFYDELEDYGLWMQDLERLADVVQPALPGMEAR